nr:myosin-10-like [Aedes albopictus]
MSSSLLDKLHRKISEYILLKNRQLRRFSRLVLDCDFLRFVEIVEDTEHLLETCIHNLEAYSPGSIFVGAIGRRVKSLCNARDHCLRRLESFERVILNCEDGLVRKIFYQRLNRTKNTFQKHFQTYRTEVEDLLLQLLDIHEIAQFQNQLSRTYYLYLTVFKNHENIRHIYPEELLRSHAIYNTSNLKLQTHTLLHELFLRHLHFLEEMDSLGEPSVESVRDRLNQEITKSRTDIVIQEAELTELRHELFPSEISLKEQRHAAIDRLDIQELDLEHRIRSIDILQSDIQGLEAQVARLIEERERVHDRLMEKRDALRSGIREVVRLEKLIQQIEKEISDRMVAFQQRLEDLELKRLAILEDETLTEEERARLLAELEEEIAMIREKHDADQQLLKEKCEELKAMSRSVIEGLDNLRDELMQKHLDEIRELEERKKNATPSELELINARIAELQKEFEENMAMLDVAQARRQYFEDEHGRYYINELGQKVYQRESGASEYILTEDGHWEKIRDAVEKQTDEKGEFYVDSFGRKIYTKRFFEDEYGRYYIDSEGKRVYLEASLISETESSVLQPEEKSLQEILSLSSEDEKSSVAPDVDDSEEVKMQRASDVKYIQETVGLPLRKGLALTFLHQPEDPIEFLARFLEKFHNDQQKEAERARLVEEVTKMKETAKSQVIEKVDIHFK